MKRLARAFLFFVMGFALSVTMALIGTKVSAHGLEVQAGLGEHSSVVLGIAYQEPKWQDQAIKQNVAIRGLLWSGDSTDDVVGVTPSSSETTCTGRGYKRRCTMTTIPGTVITDGVSMRNLVIGADDRFRNKNFYVAPGLGYAVNDDTRTEDDHIVLTACVGKEFQDKYKSRITACGVEGGMWLLMFGKEIQFKSKQPVTTPNTPQ